MSYCIEEDGTRVRLVGRENLEVERYLEGAKRVFLTEEESQVWGVDWVWCGVEGDSNRHIPRITGSFFYRTAENSPSSSSVSPPHRR